MEKSQENSSLLTPARDPTQNSVKMDKNSALSIKDLYGGDKPREL